MKSLAEYLKESYLKEKLDQYLSDAIDDLAKFDDWIDDVSNGDVTFEKDEYNAYIDDLKTDSKNLATIDDPIAKQAQELIDSQIDRFTNAIDDIDRLIEIGSFPTSTKAIRQIKTLDIRSREHLEESTKADNVKPVDK